MQTNTKKTYNSELPNYCKRINIETLNSLKNNIIELIVRKKKYRDRCYNINQLSKELNTNTRYISATFNAIWNTNYNGYVNKYRVLEAKKLLMDLKFSHLSMEDVWIKVGFSNRQSFFKSFKTLMGVSPKQFKLQVQASPKE